MTGSGHWPRLADLACPADRGFIADFVQAHPQAEVFHTLDWVEAVAEGSGQTALCLMAPEAVLPLTLVHSPVFGRSLVASGFGVGGGLLCSSDEARAPMFAALVQLARSLSCKSVTLKGGAMPEMTDAAFPLQDGWTHDSQTYVGFQRPLAASEDAELLAIPRKQRAEVRRAMGFGLSVDYGDADSHYAIYAASVHALGTPVFPRRLFQSVMARFGARAEILTVRRQGEALASVLSFYHRGAVMPFWGGGTRAARTWRANDWMYFALMQRARERGMAWFDFGRSKAGTGAAAFKRNWGFAPSALDYAYWSVDGEVRAMNPSDPRFARKVRLWRALPLALANRLGPIIARDLA